MLVVTLDFGEAVLLDNGKIEVRLLKRVGERMKVGINAPEEMDIEREAVWVRSKIKKLLSNDLSDPKVQQAISDFLRVYRVDEDLFNRARSGDKTAQFDLGKYLFKYHYFGFAQLFLEMAAKQGVKEANRFLDKIIKH